MGLLEERGTAKQPVHHGYPTNEDLFQLTLFSCPAGEQDRDSPTLRRPRLTCEQTHIPALSPCTGCSRVRQSCVEHRVRSRATGFWSHICCWLCDLGEVGCPLWACDYAPPPPHITPSPCCSAILPFDPSLASRSSHPAPGNDLVEVRLAVPRVHPPAPAPALPGLRKHGQKEWDRGSLLLRQRSMEVGGEGRG